MSLSVANFSLSDAAIAEFCCRWQIQEMALFGSVLRDDFRPDSDIDVLVTFSPQAKRGLLTLARAKHELEDATGRKVDFVVKQSILESDNWMRQKEILNSVKVIYAA
jgi:predicted nucleotidyltransferase